MRTIVVCGIALTLAGCGAPQIAARHDAQANYRASSAAYRACLQAGGDCRREETLMKADERALANYSDESVTIVHR